MLRPASVVKCIALVATPLFAGCEEPGSAGPDVPSEADHGPPTLDLTQFNGPAQVHTLTGVVGNIRTWDQGPWAVYPRVEFMAGGQGSIGINGSFVTPNSGYVFQGRVSGSEESGQLTLWVDGEWLGGLASPWHYRYEALIAGLEAGLYRVEVRHINRMGSSTEYVAFSDSVEVK